MKKLHSILTKKWNYDDGIIVLEQCACIFNLTLSYDYYVRYINRGIEYEFTSIIVYNLIEPYTEIIQTISLKSKHNGENNFYLSPYINDTGKDLNFSNKKLYSQYINSVHTMNLTIHQKEIVDRLRNRFNEIVDKKQMFKVYMKQYGI